MRLRIGLGFLVVLLGCPKEIPPPAPPPGPPPPTAEQKRKAAADALQAEVLAQIKAEDEALWAHWTQGVPLALERADAGLDRLLSDAALASAGPEVAAWISNQRLARVTAEAQAALSEREGTAEFTAEGRKIAWRDLNRVLANEKSAVKRKAIWAAARDAVGPIGEAYEKRDALLPERSDADAGTAAEAFLEATEAEWKQIVATLAQSELGLAPDKLSRADLPRVLRPNAAADAAFKKEEEAAKATAVLSALGLYGLPGLTLDLAESAKKNPLPLTIAAGGSSDVRVSFRPGGGVRDFASLLGELGRALALRATAEPRLADQTSADATYRVFAELAATPAWLKTQGVADAAAASAALSARALRLYTLRRAAANVIAQVRPGEDPATTWNAWSSRALGIAVVPEDAPRWKLERDPMLRGAALLEVQRQADVLRSQLGDGWWAKPESAAVLEAFWTGKPPRAAVAPAVAPAAPADAGAPDAG